MSEKLDIDRLFNYEGNEPQPHKPTRKETKADANKAYKIINRIFFNNELPETDIALSNCQTIREGKALAFYDQQQVRIYITEEVWKMDDTCEMIELLHHEMIHMYNHLIVQREDIEYRGTDGQYHTSQFLDTALSHGGTYPKKDPDPENGYSDITFEGENILRVVDEMGEL